MIYYRDDDPMPYLDAEFLRNEPLIVTQSWQRSRMVCEQIFDKMGFHPPIKQVSRNLSTLDALAQVDYGTVLLPSKQLSDALRRRGVYKIDPAYSVPYTFNVAVLKKCISFLPGGEAGGVFKTRFAGPSKCKKVLFIIGHRTKCIQA